ncbi:MAG: Gfo/Idh/MocA family oxidoreductase [Promicromonosporaceae bacterium]|nr:Gfo/Idh/MocA family oxidoreductase [Promicromonosporaceae bacterium]
MLKVAVVGCGNISPTHILGVLAFPELASLVALCDIVPERAERRAQEFIAEPERDNVAIYSHIDQVLARDDIDLVTIATPPSTHAELTIAALKAGKHVLVEKPMAPSLTECDAMIAEADRSGKSLSVVSQNRFRNDIAELKAVIESGLLGPIAAIQVDSAWWRGLTYYDLDWRGTWESEGGGPTLNHAIHHLDLTAWLLDGAPESVAALMTNAWHENSEVEDISAAILQYPKALASIIASVVHHGQPQRITVLGRDATIEQPWLVRSDIADGSGYPAEFGNVELVAKIEALRAALPPLTHQGHTAQIGDVLSAIATGRPPAISGADGRRTVEIVTAIYEAAIDKVVVDLPIPHDDPWYSGTALLEKAPRYFTKTGFNTEPQAPSSAKAARWEH